LIGPTRQLGRGSNYAALPYAAVVGAILPVPFWLWLKCHPTSRVRYGAVTGLNHTTYLEYWIRKTRFTCWAKYNYALSAALDVGTILGVLVTFLAFQLPKSGPVTLDWWGNRV
ncbi:hypothetical protein M407DRAFT_36408, partial [Tulasnella calospora MUT 4182]